MTDTPPPIRAIEIRAEIYLIRTKADGTTNITLNVPEFCIDQIKVLLDWVKKDLGVVIANDRD